MSKRGGLSIGEIAAQRSKEARDLAARDAEVASLKSALERAEGREYAALQQLDEESADKRALRARLEEAERLINGVLDGADGEEVAFDRWSRRARAFLAGGATPQAAARDACEECHGAKGGTPGNENVVDGRVLCDYCHIAIPRAATPQPDPAELHRGKL